MTLRKKALIVIGVTFACLIVILYFISRIVLLSGFANLEEQHTHQNVERALSALFDEIANLDTMVFDWAAWDDTYAFIEDGNEEYIRSNLVDETFTSPRLNLTLFVNSSGQVVFGKAFDLYDEEEVMIPQGIQEHLTGDAFLLRHPDTESSITGIVLLPAGPMLVASRPILTSEEEGPICGTLIMGRYLDFAEVERLAQTTHLSLTVFQLDDPQMPPDFQTAQSALLSEGTPIFVRPLNAEAIAGYALLKDVYGEPALVLRVDMPREIYAQGQATMWYLVGSLLVIGLVFSGVSLLLADKLLLSRLARLSAAVSSIGASADLSARVAATGKDELLRLTGAINGMLAALEQVLKFEKLITTHAIYFIHLPPDEIDDGLNHALQAIGELAAVARGYVFLLSQDGMQIDHAYEWCAAGFEPHIDDWKGLPLESPSWWMGKLKWFETIHVPRVAELPPEARIEREAWLPPAIQSVIVTPMVCGGALIGFLSFSSERAEKTWTEAEINLVKTVAQVLAIALVQRQAEDALQESKQRFLDVTRTTGDWIWEMDTEGRYTYVSPVVQQVLGYTPDEVLGRYYYHFFHPDDREELKARAQKIFQRQEPFTGFVNPNRHKDGNIVILQTTGLALNDAEGNLLGYRGAHRDVTAKRRLEENLAAVHALGRELVLSRDEQQVAQATVDAARLWLQCRLCGLWLVDREGKTLTLRASKSVGQVTEVTTLPLDGERGVTVAVARSGEPIYLPDVRGDPRHIDIGIGARSQLCVPLRAGKRVIGVLNVESEKPDFFGKDERQLLSTLADQTALAIENAWLYEAVTQQREQLRTLTMRLGEAEEAERQRLARELHDQVGQNLTALGINLNIVRSRIPEEAADVARSRIDDSLALVEQTTERIRGVMADLRPPVLDDYGLVAALRWYGAQFALRVGITVTVQGEEQAPRLAAAIENALFRIAQEALTNVAKHAQATQATVAVEIDDGTVRLVVADDGVGFDRARVGGPGGRRGWGLLTMAERAEAVGGHCRVESRPQQGTRVVVEVAK